MWCTRLRYEAIDRQCLCMQRYSSPCCNQFSISRLSWWRAGYSIISPNHTDFIFVILFKTIILNNNLWTIIFRFFVCHGSKQLDLWETLELNGFNEFKLRGRGRYDFQVTLFSGVFGHHSIVLNCTCYIPFRSQPSAVHRLISYSIMHHGCLLWRCCNTAMHHKLCVFLQRTMYDLSCNASDINFLS